ncbi:AAA family ATPase [Myxacorys almedinensis]|uniref:AAA+ ATPase domain-containing protein n=1 Tax=Myxacorys almedinensis A TaxID=2690445 RepID=A0A8J8CIZ0_9CYAN|nr:AAA family ATPase [Myxacorys almedinensis]NDJ18453.1 hypothetical protein [Myxacorys almedinensis A]
MPAERIEPFLENWTYLKVELNWLERLLLLTVARQRKDLKDVERVAQTKADRATSHWWKGMVSLEGNASYDSPPERRKASADGHLGNYQQQMAARIRASREQGVGLALPIVCDRFNLSLFEKNVLLLGLAPEVHRRYGQLYGYLQTGKEGQELPSVDLALRLFCRNDSEWRDARMAFRASPQEPHFSPSGALIDHRLVELDGDPSMPLLSRTFKVADRWVDYLLSEVPQWDQPLTTQAESHKLERGSARFYRSTEVEHVVPLVLPDRLKESLWQLSDRIAFGVQVDDAWGFRQRGELPGAVALLVGAAGTGKTTAVRTIAHRLDLPFSDVDVALLTPSEQILALEALTIDAPTVLLICSAEQWIGRSACVVPVEIAQFFRTRRSQRSLTFLSVRSLPAMRAEVRSHLHVVLTFSHPNPAARLLLWKQAFAPPAPLAEDIDWQWLAEKFVLTGGEIGAIARSAAFFAAREGATKIGMSHLTKALNVR